MAGTVLDLSKKKTTPARPTVKSVMPTKFASKPAANVPVSSHYPVKVNYNGKPAGSFTMKKRNG